MALTDLLAFPRRRFNQVPGVTIDAIHIPIHLLALYLTHSRISARQWHFQANTREPVSDILARFYFEVKSRSFTAYFLKCLSLLARQ
jgi:hypothetical protein